MRDFHQAHDKEDHPIAAIPVSDSIQAGDLAAGVAQDIVVPAGATLAVFASTGSFWLRDAATATVPTTFGASNMELNPTVRKVVAAQTISVISSADIKLSVAFYRGN